MGKSFYSYVIENSPVFLPLIDPNNRIENLFFYVNQLTTSGADGILVGGSFLAEREFNEFVKKVKQYTSLPIIIFPGNSIQISPFADGILFLSLISGRNPQYLIEEQVRAAPIVKKTTLEIIPTGYILIEGGSFTSVEFMSNTLPIPREKIELAKYHALAGEYLGMKLIYLDAGSGAEKTVPNEMIKEVKNYISIPLIVGGGIKSPEEMREKLEKGANGIVIGNILEEKPELAKEFGKVVQDFKKK
jgi:phosphoglycerol geranylgeranyltransferase